MATKTRKLVQLLGKQCLWKGTVILQTSNVVVIRLTDRLTDAVADVIFNMSDYDYVALGSLKLKKDGLSASKKSKKKKKEKRELEKRQLELVEQTLLDNSATATGTSQTQTVKAKAPEGNSSTAWMTEAQKKFLAQQEKRQLARVMDKATKSHKQRVEEFNTHLEVWIAFPLNTAFIIQKILIFLILLWSCTEFTPEFIGALRHT